jgi:hypothetical protein
MAKIPDGLLNDLRAAFERETKKLCRDAAHILRVPEADLLKKVKERMPIVQINVLAEDDDLPRSCQVLLKRGTVYERCRAGCVLGTSKCIRHQMTDAPSIDELPDTTKRLTRLERTQGMVEPMWCDETTKDVLNRNGEKIGEINEDNELELFILDDSDENDTTPLDNELAAE